MLLGLGGCYSRSMHVWEGRVDCVMAVLISWEMVAGVGWQVEMR